MRRISASYAKPGTVLSRKVYDSNGYMLFDAGTSLDAQALQTLAVYSVGELLIQDPRVIDVPVSPLYPPELESEISQALRQLMTESGGGKIEDELIEQLMLPVHNMVRGLFPEVIGEVNSTGCVALDVYDYVQPMKVSGLSILMGKRLGFDSMKLVNLGMSAVLMNVGYLVASHEIREKEGMLSEVELKEFQRHPVNGAEMLKSCERLYPEVGETVLQHHERLDGSGYPFGLKKEEISLPARILGIADTYYELVSKRSVRNAFMPHEAVEYIMASSAELFDPELVEIFVRQVPLYPTGVMVKMNTGELGIVTDTNLGFIARPVVRICTDRSGNEIDAPFDVDLADMRYQDMLVVKVLDY